MNPFKKCFSISFGVLFALIFLPGLPPWTTFSFTSYQVVPSNELSGIFAPNNYLDNAERILTGKVNGPEDILAKDSVWYTSNNGGEVIKIQDDQAAVVATFGEPCELPYEEAKCGRPLGLALDTVGNSLIVADGYYGLFTVDLEFGNKTLLVSPNEELDGVVRRRAKIFNSVVVDKQGVIYWTDTSSDYGFEDAFFAMLANPSGRLFKYCRWSNESTVLLDEINFANGIVLSPNEDFLVIAETASSQLLKYNLRGPNKGQKEVFATAFPGNPDNLKSDANGIWVPLVMARDSENPAVFQLISTYPRVRRFILRIFFLFELPFRVWNAVYPNTFCKKLLFATVSLNSFIELVPIRSTVLRLDWDGNVVGVLHGYDKSIRFISQVLQEGDTLYLASPFNDFIGKITLPEGFAANHVEKSVFVDRSGRTPESAAHNEL